MSPGQPGLGGDPISKSKDNETEWTTIEVAELSIWNAVSLVLSMDGSLGCGFYLQTPLGRPAALCLLVVDSHMVV